MLDLKTLSEIPFDPEASGVKTFKAFIFEKGKALHHPKEAGKYIVSGEWREQWNLCLVFFKSETKRKPEFLLNFVDYGMLSGTLSGISVETLALPLKLKRNVYNETPRLTQLEDVAGFTPIDPGSTPWSVNLAPCLKKLPQFVLHDIMAPRHLLEWVKKKTLREQLTKLEVATRKAITKEVEAMRAQDESQAEKIAQIYLARLKTTMSSLMALPPEAYEMQDRVVVLTPESTDNVPPLESPLRTKVLQGNCDELTRTQLATRAAPPPPPAEIPRPQLSPIRELGGDDIDNHNEGSGEEQEELDADEVTFVEAPNLRTARKATTRFEPAPGAAAKKKQKPVVEPEGVDVAGEGKWGINDRTGLPYTRKPYLKKDPALRQLAKAAKEANFPKPPPTVVPPADSKQLQSLKEKVTTLQLQVADLGKELAVAQAKLETEKATARLEGIASLRCELDAALLDAKHEYKLGLKDGASLATGQPYHLNSQQPHSAYGSSAGGGSSKPTSTKRRRGASQSLSESLSD